MKNVQPHTRWFMKLHRGQIKPPFPVNINCPACGRWLLKVNAATVEIENSFGVNHKELTANDRWLQIKHTCTAKITIFWND